MRLKLLILIAISLAVLAVYGQVRNHDFISHDDPDYITENAMVRSGLTPQGVVWAFTASHASNWHPLTWLSHILDCELFGLNPGAHHMTSLVLHWINSLLLFLVLARMTGALWRSTLAAALFALHPLHVESVAWAAERKDVLSTAFWLLTLWAYVRYTDRPVLRRYALVVLLFAAGLMAKPMLVTLPLVLLLLDYWPLRRFEAPVSGRTIIRKGRKVDSRPHPPSSRLMLLWEKLPLLALSAASSAVTFLVQRSWGAVPSLEQVSLTLRIENALVAYVTYIRKMFWPADLSVFYPLPSDFPIWRPLLAGFLLLLVSAFAVARRRHLPFVAVGWFWYLGTLVPVIGLLQVGAQAMADRYTYVPLIGLFIVIAWSIPDPGPFSRSLRPLVGATATAACLALGLCAWRQVGTWRNSMTLFEHALRVDPNDYLAHGSLGLALSREGRIDEAIEHYLVALRINPNHSMTANNLGLALAAKGRLQEAVAYYRRAIQLNPGNAEATNNLAWVLATADQPEMRDGAKAAELALRACELTDYSNPTVLDTLAAAYAEAGRFHEAIRTLERAVELASRSRQGELLSVLQDRLRLYRAGRPYRESQASANR